ncbi:MAG TPA: S53 family peptidase [Thermoplasmata archaeon]|nr:S53 family peptidase [Thermoplasmata archaeon]
MDAERPQIARRVVVLVLPVVLLVVLFLPAVASAQPPPVSSARSLAFLGNPAASLPFAERAGYDPSSPLGGLDPQVASGPMSVVVSFQPVRPGLYTPPEPGTPALTPSEVADEYGLSPGAYASAEAYFEARGLSVLHTSPDRLSLTLTGPAAGFASAFDTVLVSGTYEGREVTYPTSPPALPASLEAEVAGVVGLSAGFTTFSLPLAPSPDSTPSQGSSNLITPGIARQIYDASGLYNYTGTPKFASGETIVLLLWGDGYSPSDIATFFSTDYPADFPAVTVTPYPIDGAPPPSAGAVNDPSDAPQELTLDIEWSGSLAPGANLDAVYAPDGPSTNNYSPTVSSMTDALNEAVTGISGVDAISMSFGTPEGNGGGLQAAWANDLGEAMQEHITVLAATGDTGGDTSVNPCSGTPSPEYPAADPDVLAVGGTNPTLATNYLGQVTGIASETAWSDSGGGYSTTFTAPSWQLVGSAAGPISTTGGGHRGIPDVAAASANDFVYYQSEQRQGSGTSFATPLWAGLVTEMDALQGQSLGWIDGPIYSIGAAEPQGAIPAGLVGVSGGSNCLGAAGPNWNTATGWGSPRAVALYADLTSAIVSISLAASPDPTGPGSTVALTVEVTNSTDGQPVVGVPVLVTLSADTSIGPCEGTFGSGEPSTNSTGYVVVTVSVPVCYLGSKAVASAQVTADGLYGSAQAILPVNLLGYLTFLGPLTSPPDNLVLYALIMGAAIAVGLLLGGRDPKRRQVRYPVEPPAPSAPTAPAARTSAPEPPPEPPPTASMESPPAPFETTPAPAPTSGSSSPPMVAPSSPDPSLSEENT